MAKFDNNIDLSLFFLSRCYYQFLGFNDIEIFIIYLNISMMLNKILIRWFWVDVTTKALFKDCHFIINNSRINIFKLLLVRRKQKSIFHPICGIVLVVVNTVLGRWVEVCVCVCVRKSLNNCGKLMMQFIVNWVT